MLDSAAINDSLEAVLMRVPDPVPIVYARLYADYPETVELFFLDRDGRRREHMLSVTFETLLDYIGDKRFAVSMLHCERINHAELGVTPEVYTRFFWVVRDAFRDLLGDGWTPRFEAAWNELLEELQVVVHA
ncbi:MAG: globin [Polymorphobacter sp.]